MLAAPGTRLGLIPHPASEPSNQILLVEGPPDMIAARSAALRDRRPRRPRLATRLGTRSTDATSPSSWTPTTGRAAAERIALTSHARHAHRRPRPRRDDGYDLTDWLLRASRNPSRSKRSARAHGLINGPTTDDEPRL